MNFLSRLLNEDKGKNRIVGIDGLGGSGKTTLANEFAVKLRREDVSVQILHLDDFIYPKDVRYDDTYPEWYCYYNLQWRYGYLIREVLEPIRQGMKLSKQLELYDRESDRYRVVEMDFEMSTVFIVEGVFLQREELREYFDFVIYVDADRKTRMKRLIQRDSYIGRPEEIVAKYRTRYFPAEEHYEKLYAPKYMADVVLGTRDTNL